MRKELEGKQCLNYILLPVQQKKHCPGASRSTEVIWCLFSVFILFKITSPNFCLGNLSNGTTAWHMFSETQIAELLEAEDLKVLVKELC